MEFLDIRCEKCLYSNVIDPKDKDLHKKCPRCGSTIKIHSNLDKDTVDQIKEDGQAI